MPSTCGGKSQGGHKFRLKLSQEITNSLQTPQSLVQGNSMCLYLIKCFLLMRSNFVVMKGKGFTHSPVTQCTAASRRFGVSVGMTHHDAGWPWQDINTASPRAQALATLGSARAHSTTEPGPDQMRKTRSFIMIGKTVAVVLLLLLISALGTQGNETLPKALLTNGQNKC